jgi:hypothetical protein
MVGAPHSILLNPSAPTNLFRTCSLSSLHSQVDQFKGGRVASGGNALSLASKILSSVKDPSLEDAVSFLPPL